MFSYFIVVGYTISPDFARGLVKNPIYLGVIHFDGITTKDSHEPIVGVELFEKANKVKGNRLKVFGRYMANFEGTALLSGFMRCEKCGARFVVAVSKSGGWSKRYYACYSREFPGSSMSTQKGCDNKRYRVEALDGIVESEIRNIFFDKDYLNSAKTSGDRPVSSDITNKRLADIDKKMTKLMHLYAVDSLPIDILSNEISALDKEKQELKKQMEASDVTPAISIGELQDMVKDIALVWDMADNQQKRNMLSIFLKAIRINDNVINFDWTYGNTVVIIPEKEKMACPKCGQTETIKCGKNRCGNPQYKCNNKKCDRKYFTVKRDI